MNVHPKTFRELKDGLYLLRVRGSPQQELVDYASAVIKGGVLHVNDSCDAPMSAAFIIRGNCWIFAPSVLDEQPSSVMATLSPATRAQLYARESGTGAFLLALEKVFGENEEGH